MWVGEKVGLNLKSGHIVVKRKIFGDPVMSVYVLEGEPIYADSVLSDVRWYSGILGSENFENDFMQNFFHVAYRKMGEGYIDLMKENAKRIIEETMRKAQEYGWELEVEGEEIPPEDILAMFLPKTDDEDTVKRLETLGIKAFYSGDKEFEKFLRALNLDPYSVIRPLENAKGAHSVAFPSGIVARVPYGGRIVWLYTNDLERLKVVCDYIRNDEFDELDWANTEFSKSAVFAVSKLSQDRFALAEIERGKVKTVNYTDEDTLFAVLENYYRQINELVSKAIARMPSNLPPRMREIEIRRLISQHPRPEDFKKAFKLKYGYDFWS